ncbi:MAG: hypothetical protein Q4C49_09500 [Bacillota bacterium]|nr:hypothetical protein [Bacillota bacterium]
MNRNTLFLYLYWISSAKIPLILIALTFLSINILNTYVNKQNVIALESNNMCPSNTLDISKIRNKESLLLQLDTSCFWDMGLLFMDENHAYYVFEGNRYEEIEFNLTSGTFFKNKDSKEAIVGNAVETIKIDKKEYIQVLNQTYAVIGKFGQVENSNAQHMIIINDSDLMNTSTYQYLWINDQSKLKRFKDTYGFSYVQNGISRWISWDFVKKLLLICENVEVICISVLIGILYEKSQHNQNRLLVRIGIVEKKILLRNTLCLSGIELGFFLLLRIPLFYFLFILVLSLFVDFVQTRKGLV